MATATRQYGRRGVNNNTSTGNPAGNSDSGIALSPSSTASTSTPARRYVLDVPTGRTSRTRTANRMTEEYDETNARRSPRGVTYTSVMTSDENTERLSQIDSRDYYRDSGNYVEDSSIKRLMESASTYTSSAVEDQEVQALTARATPDIKNYPINVDANPELIVRPNTQRLTYTQDIAVRYLKPGTPPPPGVIQFSSESIWKKCLLLILLV